MSDFAVYVLSAPSDHLSARWIHDRLIAEGIPCILKADVSADQRLPERLTQSSAVLALISPDSNTDEAMMKACAAVRQTNILLVPALVRYTVTLPWYVENLDIEDLTNDLERGVRAIIDRLPKKPNHFTLGQARDMYLQRATLKSVHTIEAYRRSIALFFDFLNDRNSNPHRQTWFVGAGASNAEDLPLSILTEAGSPVLLHFAQWLLTPATGTQADKRPYKPSTVELRVAGVQNWLQYLDDHGLLPDNFKLAKAKRIVQDELRYRSRRNRPPQPPENLEETIYFYDHQELPARLRKPGVSDQRIRQWELTRLRNRALLHSLAETGGRISELLSLNMKDFPPRHLARQDVLRVEVVGKGGHTYYLRFHDALPAIRAYIEARGAKLASSVDVHVPLFVSHAAKYDGQRMSRTIAWRVVQRAARGLGLKSITPHDFRHWRATQLINAGHSLDVVQEYLGHRSVETTRAYYAHTDPLRVDDAAKETGLPDHNSI